MATYYVRKTGSDSADGSTGTPWLTVHKAITTCAAGDTIKIGNGVYQENSSASGYLNIATTFATAVTIEAEDAEAGVVVIQGTSGNYNVRETAATKITWNNILFIGRAGSLYVYETARLASTIIFNDCYFEPANANATYGLCAFSGSGSGVTNSYTLTRCEFYHPYAGSGYCAEINQAAATSTVLLDDCRMYSKGGGIRFVSTNNSARYNITGGSYESTKSGTQAVLYGSDNAVGTNAPIAGTITGARLKGLGHALEIGGANAATGVTITSCYIEGTGDFAVVLKDCDNAILTNNMIRLKGVIGTGTPSAIFSKGSRNCQITNNEIVTDSGHGIANWNDTTGFNTSELTCTGNNFVLKGASNLIHWNSARDAGSNYFDSNIILLRGTGNLGTIGATSAMQSLADLQTAWTTFGYALNDANSVLLTAANDTTPTQLNSIFDTLNDILDLLGELPADVAVAVEDYLLGSGARTVTITVTLSGPLEGATVRLTKGAESYSGVTNSSGVIVFNIDDGTWTVSITSNGATFSGATLVVDGAESVSYAMAAMSIAPSDVGKRTGYLVCYDQDGVEESGVEVTCQCYYAPDTGVALDSAMRTETSDGDGLVQFTNLIVGAKYKVKRGSFEKMFVFSVAAGSGSFAINSIVGTD